MPTPQIHPFYLHWGTFCRKKVTKSVHMTVIILSLCECIYRKLFIRFVIGLKLLDLSFPTCKMVIIVSACTLWNCCNMVTNGTQ